MKTQRLFMGCAIAALCSTPAFAQNAEPAADANDGGLKEIVVTAQARNQSLNDVPVSVSVVDASLVQDKNLTKLDDIQYYVPNFKMTEVGISTTIFIRGIGSGENQGFEQSVGLYVDGVHYGRAKQTAAPLLDIERVEVLRGPQSILFGKNSVAGALSIATAKPTDTLTGSVLTSYEFDADDFQTEAYLSGPITDGLRARVAMKYRDAKGHEFNLRTNQRNPQRDEFAVRGTVEFDLADNVLVTAKAEVNRYDRVGRTGQTYVSDPIAAGPFAGLTYGQVLANVFGQDASVLDEVKDDRRAATGEFSNNKMQTYQLNVDWGIGDFTLKSTTAFTRLNYNDNCDCDFTGADIFSVGFQEKFDQTSQEIRLISPENDSFDFIVGGYFQTTKQTYGDQIVVPVNSVLVPAVNAQSPGAGSLIAGTQASRTARIDGDVYSGFAQGNLKVTPDFTIQLGGRYVYEKKSADRNMVILGIDGNPLPAAQFGAPLVYGGLFGITSENLASLGPMGAGLIAQLGQLPISGERSKGRLSTDVKVKWDIAPDQMVYASWSRGYKSGGFDFRSNNKSSLPTLAASFEFDDEQATNYELGGKFSLGNSVDLNIAAFYTDYKDLQVAIYDGILGYNVGNAAGARVQGVELDGRWAATERLTISGAASFTDFKFTDYPNGQCHFGETPTSVSNGIPFCSYTGRTAPLASKFEGSITADYTTPIFGDFQLNLSADVSYKSKYQAGPLYNPESVQSGFALVNMRIALSPEDEQWQFAVLGKNLFNEQPLTFVGILPLASNTFGANALTGLFLQGRQIAVQARYNF